MAAPKDQLAFLLAALLLLGMASCHAAPAGTCEDGYQFASVTPVAPSTSLKCPATEPPQSLNLNNNFSPYTDGACNEKALGAAATVLQKLGADGKWSSEELTVTKFPAENEKICLICKKEEQITCKIVVDVAKAAESCTKAVTRGGAGAGNLNLTLPEKQTVYFKCPETDALSPANASSAYDGNCGGEGGPLPQGLVGEGNSTTGAYSLTLQQATGTATTVCYKCNPKSDRLVSRAESCHIKVTTQTTTQATTQPTSDSARPTTSGAVLPKASLTLVFAAALVTIRRS